MITLEIDIGALKNNIAALKKNTNARLYAVVKANAYGHGAEICRHIHSHVYGFAVSCITEAEELIDLGVQRSVLILSPSKMLSGNPFNIVYTVCTLSDLQRLNNCSVAVKINTGMNRLGANLDNYTKLLNAIRARKDLKLAEVFTHFYSCGGAPAQFDSFLSVTDKIPREVLRHCCASTFLNLPKKTHLDAVRAGLALYGYSSVTKPALKAYTEIIQINYVKKGEHIGYGDVVAACDMKIAVLRAGYADGFRRDANQVVRIKNKICPIAGNICMDMCMADITGIDVRRGDRAYLLDDILTAEVLAANQNTIPYEILTAFSSNRINRIYK